MASAVKLLPCPFCGEKDELYPSHEWPGSGEPYAIDCLGCGIDFTPRKGADVIAAWNRRAEPIQPSTFDRCFESETHFRAADLRPALCTEASPTRTDNTIGDGNHG